MHKNVISYEDIPIIPDISASIQKIKDISSESSDLLINETEICGIRCCIFCCEGLVSSFTMTDMMIEPLMALSLENITAPELFEHINKKMLLSTDRCSVSDYGRFFALLNSGFVLLAADGMNSMLAFGVQGYEKRSVSDTFGENNLTGSHDGFVETVRVNMSLIRRRLKSPVLVQKLLVKGETGKTDICISYLSDRVPKELISRIEHSINSIKLESILSTGYIQPFLEPENKRIFSSAGTTERPDVLCSKLIEGRVAVFVDGSPYALYIPKLFTDNFQTVDDYNFKPFYGTFIRWVKYIAFIIALLLPALYTAVALHHQELLNSTLLLILSDAEKNVPFPITAETVGVLLMYEVIKEAGLRLPRSVGGAVSIVAGIIIGDCAVQSGLISTPMLTVAALSAVSGFVIPELSQTIPILRIILVICGGIWGLFGISLCLSVILFNMCSTEDYGFPYTAPFSPFFKRALGDTAVRSGFRKMQENDFTVEELNG